MEKGGADFVEQVGVGVWQEGEVDVGEFLGVFLCGEHKGGHA